MTKTKKQSSKPKFILIIILILVLLGGLYFYSRDKDTSLEQPNHSNNSQPQSPAEQITYPVTYSDEEASSVTVVVNKKYKLPDTYAPSLSKVYGINLRTEAHSALSKLFKDASSRDYSPTLVSGYRSFERQKEVYGEYVAQDGQAKADTYSARPGHSEHQTGLAADVDGGNGCSLQVCFGDTSFGKWLASNADKYGFIIRYEKGKEEITGYQYEPWHIRYVGVDEAKKIKASSLTMDEYYGVEGGDYAN